MAMIVSLVRSNLPKNINVSTLVYANVLEKPFEHCVELVNVLDVS